MLKPYLLWLAGAGLLAALARRQWRLALLAAWALLMVLAVAPHLVGLPGSGIIEYFAVYIALYLPLLPLAGYAIGAAQRLAERWAPWPGPALARGAAGLALAAGAVWGYGWQLDHLLRPEHQLFTPADAQAVAWIEANTAPEDRFFVNAFPAYGGALLAGSDGGWWLPLLAGRQTNLPPLTYGSERGVEEGYARQVRALAEALRGRTATDLRPAALDLTTPENYARLLAGGYDYVYLGARANPGPETADHIDAAALAARPDLFALAYAQDGVRIYAFTGAAP
jgi:hypothetical protein